jgi:hypothetical protein
VVLSPVVTTTPAGKKTLSFSLRLGSAAALGITLAEPSGKTVLKFSTNAARGKTSFTKNIPALELKNSTHLTLEIVSISHGKKHTTSVPLKI